MRSASESELQGGLYFLETAHGSKKTDLRATHIAATIEEAAFTISLVQNNP